MPVPVMSGAEPFSSAGTGAQAHTGVLVLHGYTGTVQGVRPWASHLAEQGYAVSAPLLPGHGTSWQDLGTTRWQQWYAAVDDAFTQLRDKTERVVVAGLSMGGLLATKLAIEQGPRVAGLILVNPIYLHDNKMLPALPLLRRLVPSFPGIANDIKKQGGEAELGYDRNPLQSMHSQTQLWTDVRRDLGEVIQPVLLMHSRVDHVVPTSSSAYFVEHVGSHDLTEIWLENSFHVATLDNDADLIHDESVRFIERLVSDTPDPASLHSPE